MNFINMTPHPLHEVDTDTYFPKGEVVPRIAVTSTPVKVVDGITLTRSSYGVVENLPEPIEDTLYVVSAMVMDVAKDRNDLVVPGILVRDSEGNIIGCRGFRMR